MHEPRILGDPVLAVFDNLLPDNDDIRRRVAERSHAGGADAYTGFVRDTHMRRPALETESLSQSVAITGDLVSLNAALLLFRERVLRFGPLADPAEEQDLPKNSQQFALAIAIHVSILDP